MWISSLMWNENPLEKNNSQDFSVDVKNRKTCDREQFKTRRLETIKHPQDVTRQQVNRYLNRYFRDYNKKKWYKDSARAKNDFFQPVIKQDPGIFSLKKHLALQTVRSYTNVVPTMPLPEYEKVMKHMLETANANSLVCIENHSTFAWPLALISELRRCANYFGLPLPNIYICISGALLTQTQGRVGQRSATLIQTLAHTDNSHDIKLPRWAFAEIWWNYKNTLMELASKPGNLIRVAPTASTDKIKRADNGLATGIYFGDDTVPNVAGFLKNLRELVETNHTSVALLGLNGTNMKDPLWINELEITQDTGEKIAWTIGNTNEKNHNRAPGNTYLSVEMLSPDEVISCIDTKTVMSTLASHVKNRDGKPIGHAVDIETMRAADTTIKVNTKNQKFSFEIGKWPMSQMDFDDTRYCKAIRAIFEAGKDYQRLGLQNLLLRALKQSKHK